MASTSFLERILERIEHVLYSGIVEEWIYYKFQYFLLISVKLVQPNHLSILSFSEDNIPRFLSLDNMR